MVLIVVGTSFFLFSKQSNIAEKINKTDSLKIAEKIKVLGRSLFYDRRLSVNNSRACATCHNPDFAFTDGYKKSIGAFADLHQRNSLPLFNLSYLKYFTAADSSLQNVMIQMDKPLFGIHPIEMGAAGNEEKILQRLKEDTLYKRLFKGAFNNVSNAVSFSNIKKAISVFILSIRSDSSPYDCYKRGDSNALSLDQKNGMGLFFSQKFNCSSCHGGGNFSTPTLRDSFAKTIFYFNTGLYNVDGCGGYPKDDQGLFSQTKNAADMGKFRVPTLRNLAFTAPYLHDGSAATITEVVNIFLNGGRNIAIGINKGKGCNNPYKYAGLQQIESTAGERMMLISFLYSLSDSSFLKKQAYSNPFAVDETDGYK